MPPSLSFPSSPPPSSQIPLQATPHFVAASPSASHIFFVTSHPVTLPIAPYLPTTTGRSIPLGQIAKAGFAWEPGVLWREGRDYAATVQGDIVEGLQGATVTAQLDPLFAPIRAKMLPGYRIEVAGAVEESSKGQGSISAGAPLMLFIMFTLLMLQLHSFSRSVLVFLTGRLALPAWRQHYCCLGGRLVLWRSWASLP